MLDFTISGQGFAMGIGFLAFLVIAAIITTRRYLARQSMDLNVKEIIHPAARNKRPEVDALKWSGTMLKGGLAVALSMTILAFSWTTYEQDIFIPNAEDIEDLFMENIPNTYNEPPPPPPPPPPVLIEPIPDIEPDIEPIFKDMSIDEDEAITLPEPVVESTPAPPPVAPPPVIEEEEAPLIFAERMPRFLSNKCENLSDEAELTTCAQKEMLQFIYKNIKYPAIARENNVQGTVVVRFVVSKTGNIENVEILRDIGAGCGAETLRVVKKFPKWKPGRQGGRNVPVYFNLPVRFVLDN